MRIWVTGASGFVGTRLLRSLAEQGHTVTGSDRELDVTDAAEVSAKLQQLRPDAVIHLAAISFVPEAASDPLKAFRVNYLGTRAILEGVRQETPGARVLLVASSAVYGPADPSAAPFDESSPLRPADAYGHTKAAADLLGAAYAERGLDVVRLRPFNHTGPGRPEQFVESSIARQLAEMELGRRPARLALGNLDATRDFLHVDDVIDAYQRLLQPGAPAGVFNVASGVGTTVRELVERLAAAATVSPEIVNDPARWRPTDASVGCAQKLRDATGWRPAHALESTLAELLAHWRVALAGAA
jgi:GDP-4-dehydro-6-deoxy-D-mannose reductase